MQLAASRVEEAFARAFFDCLLRSVVYFLSK